MENASNPRRKSCKICGDVASGFNFGGQLSCKPCRIFFRRTILSISSNSNNVHCFNENRCEITVSNRTRCISCRYKKCLDIGMKMELVNQKSIGFYDNLLLKKESNSNYFGKNTINSRQFFKTLQKDVAQLIQDAQNAIKHFILNDNSNYQQSRAIQSFVDLINFTQESMDDEIKLCKSFGSFKSLTLDDQMALMKPFHTSFQSIMIASAYDFENDAFLIYKNALKKSPDALFHAKMKLYCCSKGITDFASIFRSFYFALQVEMEHDNTLRNLLIARQLFRRNSRLSTPEIVAYQQAKYNHAIQKYLELKYQNPRKVEQKYAALMYLMEEISTIENCLAILAKSVDQSQLADIPKEIYTDK